MILMDITWVPEGFFYIFFLRFYIVFKVQN